MNRFQLEIHEKYTKIPKSANLIGFLNWLVSFTPFGQKWRNSNRIVNPLTHTYPQTWDVWGWICSGGVVGMSTGKYLQGWYPLPRHLTSGVGMSRKEPYPQGIRSPSGRYASYWNVFLFLLQELSANYLLLNKKILHAPSLILLPLFGSLSDKTGRKLLVMISLTGSSLGSLLYLVGSFNSKSIYSYHIQK